MVDYDKNTFPELTETWLRAALDENTPMLGDTLSFQYPLNEGAVGDLLGTMASRTKPLVMVIESMTYAGLLGCVRNYLDLECRAWALKLGVRCKVQGVPLMTSREARAGDVWVLGRDENGWLRQRGRVEGGRKPFPGSIYAPPTHYC